MPIVVRFYKYHENTKDLDLPTRVELSQKAVQNACRILSLWYETPDATHAPQEIEALTRQLELEDSAFHSEGETPHYFIEMDYLLSRARETLGHEAKFSFGGARLPVRGIREFSQQGGVLGQDGNDLHSHTAVFDAVALGTAVAAEVIRTLEKQEESDN
jgi:hypothetical protein